MVDTERSWKDLTAWIDELDTLGGVASLLGWDQQVMMPRKAAEHRGEQMAAISRIVHERFVDPRVGRWLDDLQGADLDDLQRAAVRNLRRDYDRATRVSADLVSRAAIAQARGFESWIAAKQASDYSRFEGHLAELLDLSREVAHAIDPARHPYDVLLDDFDPGTTVEGLRETFSRLRDGLAVLIRAIGERPGIPSFEGEFPVEAQKALHAELIGALGFDRDAGRMDASEHPFTTNPGLHDTRITTHVREKDLLFGLYGTIHETGHALYEQGLPTTWRGTGVGKAASMGLHESQSRFWENFVGRSLPFCRWLEPALRRHLGPDSPRAEAFYRATNRVEPGFVRISADEVTYNLHIIVRFEIEVELFEGRLAVRDLPAAWNARTLEYLGVEPPDDARGVLQDVHWSAGSFAYFPSYTLGNLYSASLGATLEACLPDLWEHVEAGRFTPILDWLRENVHSKGHLLESPDLVRSITGERDMVEDLLAHLWNRQGALYGVRRPVSG